jgi:hypothetical protein
LFCIGKKQQSAKARASPPLKKNRKHKKTSSSPPLKKNTAAVGALWLLVPNDYDARDVLPAAAAFLDAQRSGHPVGAPRPAAAAMLFPAIDVSAFRSDAVPGGFYMGADYVKHSFPLATSLTTLAWSMLTFGAGYAAAGARGQALLDAAVASGAADRGAAPWAASAASTTRGVVKHAARYLVDCHTAEFEFVARQGNPSDYVVELMRANWEGQLEQGSAEAALAALGDLAPRSLSLLAASGSGGGGEFRPYNASRAVQSARGFWAPPGEAPSAATDRTAVRLSLASAGGADALAAASAALASASLALRLPPLRDDPAADLLTRTASSSFVDADPIVDEDAPDQALADQALRHARQLYTFALALQAATQARPPAGTPRGGTPTYCAQVGCYQGRQPSEGGGYRWLAFPSTSASDDLALAAAWLHRATGVKGYLEDARAHLWRHASSGEAKTADPRYYAPSHDNSAFSAAILLGGEVDLDSPPPAVAERYRDGVSSFARAWLSGRTSAGADVVQQTPRGLAYLDAEGSPLPTALAAAHLAAQAAAAVRRQQEAAPGSRESRGAFASLPASAAANLECFARRQVYYALGGSLGQGRSFVVGVGRDPPQRPMHRQASCPEPSREWLLNRSPGDDPITQSSCGVGAGLLTTEPNPITLTGAVVAGPDAGDGYPDDRPEPSSAVGFHLQAPFVGALAALSAPGAARDRSCASDGTGGFASMAAAAALSGGAGGGADVVAADPLAVSMI